DENNDIKGVYLLGDNQLNSLVEDEKYVNLKGVEGVVLAVSEEVRGQGWGNKLKDFPKTLEVDYIWGQQLKSLNNLEDWLKRREDATLDERYVFRFIGMIQKPAICFSCHFLDAHRKSYMQETLNKMVASVRHELLSPEHASRTIHECAALLGLQL
ncbi:MAG: hypothetical protein ACK55I_11490, partial [bacterium]